MLLPVNILPSDCLVCGDRIACPLRQVVPGTVPKKLPHQYHLKALCGTTGSKGLERASSPPVQLLHWCCILPICIPAKKHLHLATSKDRQRAHYLLGKTVLLLASAFSMLSNLGGHVGRVSWTKDPVLALCLFCRREQLDTMFSCPLATPYWSIGLCSVLEVLEKSLSPHSCQSSSRSPAC